VSVLIDYRDTQLIRGDRFGFGRGRRLFGSFPLVDSGLVHLGRRGLHDRGRAIDEPVAKANPKQHPRLDGDQRLLGPDLRARTERGFQKELERRTLSHRNANARSCSKR
jgi:hypothetical protein